METKFNFNSQICTTKEQSECLLTLGLKKETADMFYAAIHIGSEIIGYQVSPIYNEYNFEIFSDDIPAWSLGRLIEMIDDECVIYLDKFTITGNVFGVHNNLFDNIIDCIEWLIKEGHFDKEYLV